MASTSQQQLPAVAPQTTPVKMDLDSSEVRNISEEDLLRLKKINFKKKVSGEKMNDFYVCHPRFSNFSSI
jgi:hypothetical protein